MVSTSLNCETSLLSAELCMQTTLFAPNCILHIHILDWDNEVCRGVGGGPTVLLALRFQHNLFHTPGKDAITKTIRTCKIKIKNTEKSDKKIKQM